MLKQVLASGFSLSFGYKRKCCGNAEQKIETVKTAITRLRPLLSRLLGRWISDDNERVVRLLTLL